MFIINDSVSLSRIPVFQITDEFSKTLLYLLFADTLMGKIYNTKDTRTYYNPTWRVNPMAGMTSTLTAN